MKTSNKLLLTILGIVLGSLLTYNIALRAEYQKGTYKDKFRNYQTLALADFDQVEVQSKNVSVRLTQGPFAVRVVKHAAPNVRITRVGRRLIVTTAAALDDTWSKGNQVVISCPDLRQLSTTGSWASVEGFTLDSLLVQQSRNSEVELTDNKIGFLRASAGHSAGSQAKLTIESSNRIQGASLSIQNRSELTLQNVYIPQFHARFSDSAEAVISGASLRMMKQ